MSSSPARTGDTVASMNTLSEFADTLSEAKRNKKVTAKDLALQTGLSPLAVRQILADSVISALSPETDVG